VRYKNGQESQKLSARVVLVRPAQITRHMLGLFHGIPGGRHWRQVLSEEANRPGAVLAVLEKAVDEVLQRSGQFAVAAE